MALVSCRPAPMPGTPTTTDAYSALRDEMVEEGIIGLGVTDQAVVAAMGTVPRHAFVPAEYLDQAYENHPLPIGHGQTISQPYIVALMTEQAGIGQGDHVLEIGTGSGYQAAVLAELGAEVYSIEIIRPLADEAAGRLADLGYGDVVTRHGDGYLGWPEEAPFNSIIVTAAPDHVPQPLLEQLRVGGIMVIPVGPVGGYQELWRIERARTTRTGLQALAGSASSRCCVRSRRRSKPSFNPEPASGQPNSWPGSSLPPTGWWLPGRPPTRRSPPLRRHADAARLTAHAHATSPFRQDRHAKPDAKGAPMATPTGISGAATASCSAA